MKTEKLHQLIIEKLNGALIEKGFEIAKDDILECINGNKDVTRIVTYIQGKASCYLGLWIGKRFNVLETIIEKYIDQINSGHYPTDTLKISENSLKGIHNATPRYVFENTEEGVDKLVIQLEPLLKSKLLPFLDKYSTYDQLHLLVNTPPDKFSDNVDYFSHDGMTQFRRMVIAKIVKKDYEIVCDHVKNVIVEGLKTQEPDLYDRFNKVFYELKEELDRTEF